MTIGMIASIAIGVTTQELVSSLASMVILTMFVLLIIFVTIVLFVYSVELKRREEDAQLEKKKTLMRLGRYIWQKGSICRFKKDGNLNHNIDCTMHIQCIDRMLCG